MLQVLARLLLAFSAILFMMSAAWAGDKQGDKAKGRVLFIGNKSIYQKGTHAYMHASRMLSKCVESTPGMEGVLSDGWPKDAKMFEGVKSICFYSGPVPAMLMAGKHEAEFEALVKKGVGLVMLHASVMAGEKNLAKYPQWLDFVGGTWHGGHTSRSKGPLKQLVADHPINRGWKEFDVEDETYIKPLIKGGKPVLQIRERDGTDVIVGWTQERADGGRSFTTTLGHHYKYFQNENFRRLVMNSILWTARADVPAEGASVKVAEKYLVDPPKDGSF